MQEGIAITDMETEEFQQFLVEETMELVVQTEQQSKDNRDQQPKYYLTMVLTLNTLMVPLLHYS